MLHHRSSMALLAWYLLTIWIHAVPAAEPVAISAAASPTTASHTSSISANASATLTASASIPSSAAAGGITITQPQQTAAQSYYKITSGVNITLGWNFTSVLQYPKSLVVQAYCSENHNTYTIASSLPGAMTNLTWSPWEYDQRALQLGQPQLIQATYRLQIFDERGLGVAAQPGLFQPNTKVQFALYQPKPYTPISAGWICTGCNGASARSATPVAASVWACLVVVMALWMTELYNYL